MTAPSPPGGSPNAAAQMLERIGRSAAGRVAFFGLGASLFAESVRWLIRGRQLRQIVRAEHIAAEMMDIGVFAIPIVSVVSIAIGFTLSMQGIEGLEQFGAQHQVIGGVALGVMREFGPLITGIIVAGRSVDLAELEGILREELSKQPQRPAHELKLLLRADRTALAAHLNRVVTLLESHGIGAARLATEVPR